MLRLLLDLGIVSRVPLEPPPGRSPSVELFVVDLRADAARRLHPFELLVAIEPREGIICYGSALAFHELTTQRLPFHHVAVPRPDRRPAREAPPPSLEVREVSLGTPVGVYGGQTYYVTRRDPRFLVEHRTHLLDQHTRFRITSRTQTLLDTLHRPTHCGGTEVVFEAWERYLEGPDPEAVADLLRRIDDDDLTRRVGWMWSTLAGAVDPALGDLVDAAQARARAQGRTIQLLHACPWRVIDKHWLLAVP